MSNSDVDILDIINQRMGIVTLNDMQQQVLSQDRNDLLIFSPTGTGKTLAYAIAIIKHLSDKGGLQAVVIAPSRELVIQIHEILRTLAVGHKTTCLYGGHRAEDERRSLSVEPSIIVATPGRLLDHLEHGRLNFMQTHTVVIDEFDKCLELGFEHEMRQILHQIPRQAQRLLTSATRLATIPEYVKLQQPITLDFTARSGNPSSRMAVYLVPSAERDKLGALRKLLLCLGQGKAIVFVGFRDAVSRVANDLNRHNISAGIYHGALDQTQREKSMAMFRNGSIEVLVTTDLASRGLDIEDVRHIIHYHLPLTNEIYTHRNGRTARVNNDGDIYLLIAPEEECPNFIKPDDTFTLHRPQKRSRIEPAMTTLHIMAGKKEKISKGDIMGFIANNGGEVSAEEIGCIEVKDHYSFVALPRQKAQSILKHLQHARLKGRRIRISIAAF